MLIEILDTYKHKNEIVSTVAALARELAIDTKLEKVLIKLPTQKPIDMNYLNEKKNLLELEIVDSLDNLEGRIRHELMHVADQMDDAFGYTKTAEPKAGTAELRRYKYLWNVYIDSRFIKAGKSTYDTKEGREKEVSQCFPEFSQETQKRLFEYLWNLCPLTHRQMIKMSKNIFEYNPELRAFAESRGERLMKFKTLEELNAFARTRGLKV